MPAMQMLHEVDPRKVIQDQIGDLSQIEVMYSQVLIGVYIRPKKTAGGILLTDATQDEDRFQGVAGLVLKMGPQAFKDTDDVDFQGQKAVVGDWVVIRASDGWAISINKTYCRMLPDAGIKMIIPSPDVVF